MSKKRLFIIALLIFCVAGIAIAGTNTSNLSMYKPDEDESDWADEINANFDTLDTAVGTNINSSGAFKVNSVLITNIETTDKTGDDGTLVTGTKGLTDECAKWNVDGDLVSFGGACGGSGALGLSDLVDVGVTTPTSGNVIIADGDSFESVSLSGDCTVNASGNVSCVAQTTDIGDFTFSSNEVSVTGTMTVSGTGVIFDIDNDSVAEVTILGTSGNVGINNIAPTTNLHVTGGTRITGLVSCDTVDTDANGVLSCGTDQTGAGGSAIILDLADDASNESTDLIEIATTGDTNSVFSEPSGDKLLITLGNNWPSADTADALSADPTDCAANTFATTIAASGNLTCATPTLGTDSTGNYVATVVGGDGISSTGATSGEGINHTLSVDALVSGGDADSTTIEADGGLEIVSNKISLIRGCSDDQILRWDETQDDWNCENETSAGALQLTNLTDVSTAGVTAGRLLIADGVDWESVSMSGDCTITAGGVTTCDNNVTESSGSTITASSGIGDSYVTQHTETKTITSGSTVFIIVSGSYDGSIVGTKKFRLTADGNVVHEIDVILASTDGVSIVLQGVQTGLSGSVDFDFDAAINSGAAFAVRDINMTVIEF